MGNNSLQLRFRPNPNKLYYTTFVTIYKKTKLNTVYTYIYAVNMLWVDLIGLTSILSFNLFTYFPVFIITKTNNSNKKVEKT